METVDKSKNQAEQKGQVDELVMLHVRDCAEKKADEPWRICPNCGGYPLVLEGSYGGGIMRTFCDFCMYEDIF